MPICYAGGLVYFDNLWQESESAHNQTNNNMTTKTFFIILTVIAVLVIIYYIASKYFFSAEKRAERQAEALRKRRIAEVDEIVKIVKDSLGVDIVKRATIVDRHISVFTDISAHSDHYLASVYEPLECVNSTTATLFFTQGLDQIIHAGVLEGHVDVSPSRKDLVLVLHLTQEQGSFNVPASAVIRKQK